MSLTFLRSDVLRTVQAQLIQTYGGLPGVRNEDGLESAVARPKQMHNYTGEERIGAIAASLAWALLRNHPFADGNNRIALAAFVMSAELNEHRLTCSEAEETAMILKAAGSEISEDEWTAWALRVVVRK
ncbi:MAG: type II toxin-antitoxin system death-on-curing family toxin [Janthinobacterium lividum]